MALSGASAAVAASATSVNSSVATAAVMDPLSVWESYFDSASERVPDPSEGVPPANGTWSSAAAFIAESPTAPLL
eukprot:3723536-Prymnesium_polylepis.1